MKVTKPQDSAAETIKFGIEIETMIPTAAQVAVGSYHAGGPVTSALAQDGTRIQGPSFQGAYWRAERDGSIQVEPGYTPCEFVSPILSGHKSSHVVLGIQLMSARCG